jgi:hypothetical protein
MQAWAGVLHGVDCPGSTGKPDSSVFATTELMSAADSGLSIDEVWDQKYGGFFKASAPHPRSAPRRVRCEVAHVVQVRVRDL